MQQASKFFLKTTSNLSFVNIGSIYGVVAPDFSIYDGTDMTVPIEYSAVKAGLIGMQRYIVSYINNSNFRINMVSPGGLFDNQNQIFTEAYRGKTLGSGMLSPHDMVGAIEFLLSNASLYINAQNIVVDDGFTL